MKFNLTYCNYIDNSFIFIKCKCMLKFLGFNNHITICNIISLLGMFKKLTMHRVNVYAKSISMIIFALIGL